jgi:flagellar motor switch protein FliM
MNQILSQSEVDALLAAVTDGDIKPSGGGDSSQNVGEVKTKDDRNIVSYYPRSFASA